jgi:biopolymer transport protein ExbD
MSFGRFERGADETPMSDINMTPLIDVMLVLLVIFIITAPLLAGHVALDLPKVAAAPAPRPVASLAVALQKDGSLYLDARPVTPAQLQARFTAAAQRDAATEVRIRADTAVPYGAVAALLAAAQQAGLTHIGFVTQPAPAASRP